MDTDNPFLHLDDSTPWQSLVTRYTMDIEDESLFLTWLRSKDIPEDEAKHRLTAAELDVAYEVYDRLTATAERLAIATFRAALDALSAEDPEAAHVEAENFLLDWLRAQGNSEVADAYAATRARTGFWYA